MWLREIEADRLRNLKAVSVNLSSGLTVITGRNGQGKSSMLEAIYLLATSRSFRTRKVEEIINWDTGPLRVAGSVSWRGGEVSLKVIADGTERRLTVDGVESNLENYLGRLDLVDLSGERMKVLRGAPNERRRFLDRGLVGLNPSFLKVVGEYRKMLAHRNALLRTISRGSPASRRRELEVWDRRLAECGSRVHKARREYAMRVGTRLGEAGRILFPGGEELVVRYLGSPASSMEGEPGAYGDKLLNSLEKGREKDLDLGYTSRGPHRDDVAVELDGVDLRKFGSAGQLRSAMVAMKIAKLSLLRADREESPVFLMDDYDTDLDEVRAANLASYLHEGGFQAVVATSKEKMAARLGVPFHRIRMTDGQIA